MRHWFKHNGEPVKREAVAYLRAEHPAWSLHLRHVICDVVMHVS